MKKALYKLLLNSANRLVRSVTNQPASAEKRTLLLAGSSQFQPALPVNIAALPDAMRSYFDELVELPPVYLHTLQRAAVSWHMLVFRRLRIFLPAIAHPREEGHYNNVYLLKEWTDKKMRSPRDGRALALVHNQWTSSNYYHWLVDSLPRLLLLQANHADCRLLMPAPVAAFVQESAAMLGFTDLLLLKPRHTLVNANLLVPDHVTTPGYQHPALLRQLRAQLLNVLYPDGQLPVPHRQVYVSRRSQRVRRLVNEYAIEEILKEYGYETVEFENLSFTEQIKLMAETKRFVSIHGAGLTNMLFLPPNARVGELINGDKLVRRQNKDFENLIYFRMAAALQVPYYCLPCAGISNDVSDDMLSNEAHIQVEVTAFEQLLQQLND